jgi:cullin-associated NEDD8-dissociated protein 1
VQEVKLECLDIITDLLKRFGHDIEPEHENLMGTVLQQLQHQRPVVRKRATASLGSLAICLSDPLLKRLTETLLGRIESPGDGAEVRTLIQTIGSISRTVGYRMGKDLDQIVPLFLKCIGDPEDEEQQNEEANELRENCLQGFESFVLRCPREVTPHLSEIMGVCQAFLQFDPNYTYGSDEDEDMQDEDDMEFSDEDFGDFSDDDDTSWKVRRASLHVLTAIVSTRPEMLNDLYSSAASLLIGRFKEREENVQLDVLACFTELLRVTTAAKERKGKSPAKDLLEDKVRAPLPSPRPPLLPA